MNVTIKDARAADMSAVDSLSKQFDLDREEMTQEQFLVAKENDKIVGFGRLKNYDNLFEVSTVGIVPELRQKGIGTQIVNELLKKVEDEVFVTCVIPEYFKRFGFEEVKNFPEALLRKYNFCKSFGYTDKEVFVMRLKK